MENKEILKRAIKKAVKNGYSAYFNNLKDGSLDERSIPAIIDSVIGDNDEYTLIFSHYFAKAFWPSISCYHNGDEMRHTASDCGQPAWRYYQHKMLDEVQEGRDPIKYLEKFL